MMWPVAPWWHWLSMAGFWLVIVLLAIWATTRLFPAAGDPPLSARRILDERLARGELDIEEYRHLRHELTAAGQGPTT
jgi:putative membrane protein